MMLPGLPLKTKTTTRVHTGRVVTVLSNDTVDVNVALPFSMTAVRAFTINPINACAVVKIATQERMRRFLADHVAGRDVFLRFNERTAGTLVPAELFVPHAPNAGADWEHTTIAEFDGIVYNIGAVMLAEFGLKLPPVKA